MHSTYPAIYPEGHECRDKYARATRKCKYFGLEYFLDVVSFELEDHGEHEDHGERVDHRMCCVSIWMASMGWLGFRPTAILPFVPTTF